jgi:hypothetical protein
MSQPYYNPFWEEKNRQREEEESEKTLLIVDT